MIHHDDGFRMLKNVRTSPAYWEARKKELMAMIRQLGPPTLFLTLSANEYQNPELLQALYETHFHKKISVEAAMKLDSKIKTNLVKNDPVMCARYFEHKVRKFMILLQQENCLFEPYTVSDYYLRVEFQMRGSPHVHIFLWLKNAPVYHMNNHISKELCIQFIDLFISCFYDERNPYINMQMHNHKPTCYKKKGVNKKCRFNLPVPVFPETHILDPFTEHEEKFRASATANFQIINEYMENLFKKPRTVPFNDILSEINMSKDNYILAVRSSLQKSKIFLKRSSQEVRINYYNKDILNLFESNMDIQFVLNEYAVASYIINYIGKAEAGLTKMLQEAVFEMKNGNLDLKQKLRRIANVFINAKLISAQEAAYICLSMPLSKSTCDSIFINTGKYVIFYYLYLYILTFSDYFITFLFLLLHK